MNKARNVFIHVIGCSLFLMLPFLFSPDNNSNRFQSIFQSNHFRKDLIHYLLLIGFFYFNYYILVSKLYFEKKYFLYAAIIIGCFFLIALLPSFIIPDNPFPPKQNFSPPPDSFIDNGPGMPGKPPRNNSIFSRINHNFFLFFVVLFFSSLLRIALRWRQTEKEKLNAELSYLKAQVNPHFLFNTLNSIYSLAIEKSDSAAPAVAKLSSMMRYVISDSARDFVPLDKEIEYINSYIDLQKIRFGDSVKIIYEITGSIAGKKIAPLILIPFIENAFKYGVNAEEDAIINVAISIPGNDTLIMKVTNNKVHVQNPETENTGTGIANTRNRLQLIYPAKHTLDIQEDEKQFLVLLTLLLK